MGLQITDTTYAGEAASYMLTRMVTGADTIQKGAAMVQDGIKKKFTIPKVEVADLIQPRQETPTSKGSMTVNASALTPEDCMLYIEFNPRDFEQHWYAFQLENRLLDETLPQTAESFIMMQTMARLNEWFEMAWWQSRKQFNPDGDNITPSSKGVNETGSPFFDSVGAPTMFYWDGFIKKALDNSAVAVTSPIALTSGNIRDKMTEALAKLPKALLFKFGAQGTSIIMSYQDKAKYDEALRTDSFKNIRSDEAGYTQYRGYDIKVLAGLPENTFFVTTARPDNRSNTWIGINSVDDNTLDLKKLQNNSELYFIKGLFKADVNFGFYDQVVIYTTQTA